MDIKNWKEFQVGELFTLERGKEPSPKRVKDGVLPMINEINENNGIAKQGVSESIFKKNAITISVNYASNVFYQPEEFIASVNILIIRNEYINKYTGLFLAGVLREKHKNYDYVNKISKERLENEDILLPATPSGDPDWAYMEAYMKEMEEKAKERLNRLEEMRKQEKKKIDVSGWGEFQVGELFDIKPTKAYKLNNAFLLDDGNTPVLANSSYNNGIGGYSTLEATEKGNIITFSDTVDANTIFYQEHEFIGYAHVQGMYPKDNYKQQWNSYCLKFFASVFRETALLKGYNYGNKFRRDNAMKMSILLPVTSAGTPDWDYMEQYMREMEEKAKKILKGLL